MAGKQTEPEHLNTGHMRARHTLADRLLVGWMAGWLGAGATRTVSQGETHPAEHVRNVPFNCTMNELLRTKSIEQVCLAQSDNHGQ